MYMPPFKQENPLKAIFKTAPKLEVCNCSNLKAVKLPDYSQFIAGLISSITAPC